MEDGSFQAAPGAKAALKGKGKGKGKKGKFGKGKSDDGPDAKRPRLAEDAAEKTAEEEEQDDPKADFEREWKDKQVCLINLKAAALNGTHGFVKEFMGTEEILVEGKKKIIKRYMVALEGGKGEKSIKMENLFKVMTGSLVKLRGLDQTELNDSVGECGRLDAGSMRYDVTLSDGRHIKAKPANVEFLARYEASVVAGSQAQMERFRSANGLRDRLEAIEEFNYPAPSVLPATSLEEYGKKFPKAVVIGRSNAANQKGAQVLMKDIISSQRVPPGSRLIFVSMPREKCVAPAIPECRHDELLRLSKFAEWVSRRCAPRAVYFMLPGVTAKGTPSMLNSATCAWPFYAELCTEVVILESERWHKSVWARMDALTGIWARKPLYVLPEKYNPPVELPNAPSAEPAAAGGEDDALNAAKETPLSFKPEEPFTISRPSEAGAGAGGIASNLLSALEERAYEFEAAAGGAKVQRPTLAVRRLG